MAGKSQNTLEDLNLTKDELDRFSKAFKDEEFRKLFREYAEEINDPENRKKYEEEIAKMEAERNMDIQFVHPKPGYVLKTVMNGKMKAFVNIATNELVEKPSHERSTDAKGNVGLVWSIPHFFAPPREDIDKEKKECRVFDVVFHPDTFRMAESNARFRKIVEDTAWDGIEKQFSVTFDRKNCRRPKMKYKGQPVATVIRKRKEGTEGEDGKAKGDEKSPLDSFPYPYDSDKTTAELSEALVKEAEEREKEKEKKSGKEEEGEEDSKYTTPKFQLKYSQDVRMEDFGSLCQPNDDLAAKSRRPDRVVVDIELPLIKSAASLDLDIGERALTLVSEKPAAYKLLVKFAYPVLEEGGAAKFDKKTRTLRVTLPVVPEKPPLQPPAPPPVQEAEEEEEKMLVEELPTPDAAGDTPQPEVDPFVVAVLDELPPVPADSPARVPEISWREDDHCLSLLCRARSVQVASARLWRDRAHRYRLAFTSLGGGGWPLEFALFFRIAYAGETDQPFHDRAHGLDAQAENFVVRLGKRQNFKNRRVTVLEVSADGARWERIEASHEAADAPRDELAELFGHLLTVSAAADEVGNSRCVEVTEMSHQRMAISLDDVAEESELAVVNFEPARLEEEEMEEEVVSEAKERSASIEVVFQEPPQRLHGILKKQTSPTLSVSTHSLTSSESLGESQEGVLWCRCVQHGSADDIHGLQKSVSFSGRPEVASFNVSQPVCSLHATLKNRRRNLRRREQRRRVASFNRGSSETETEEVMTACAGASRGRGRGRGFVPRQRHYSDSFVTEMADFVNPNDFELQEPAEKEDGKVKEGTFEPCSKKGKKRRKQQQKEQAAQKYPHEEHSEVKEQKQDSLNSSSALSWKDDVESQRASEHRTHCPIDFVNADVFALDDD